MKTSVKNINPTRRSITVELPINIIEQAMESAYGEIAKKASLPGFRPGKVPIELVRQRFKDEAMHKAIDTLIEEYTKKAIEEHKLAIVSQAVIKDVHYEPGKPLLFQIEIDVRPELTLHLYKGIPIKKKKTQVQDSDVHNTLDYLREQGATCKPLLMDRPSQEGDYVLCALESFIDEEPFEKKNDCLIALEKGKTREEFYQQLLGVSKGQTKEFFVSIADQDEVDPKYKGKQVKYVVQVKDVTLKELPELTDEFAQKTFNVPTVAEMKEKVHKMLEQSFQKEAYQDMRLQITQTLLKENTCDVPQSLVETQLHYLVEESKKDLVQQKKIAMQDAASLEDELKKRLTPVATDHVRLWFIFDEIERVEHIKVTEEDIKAEVKRLAAYYGKSEEEMTTELAKQENTLKSLLFDLRDRKIMDFLIQHAVVSEETSGQK